MRSCGTGTSAVTTALVDVLEIFSHSLSHSMIQPVGGSEVRMKSCFRPVFVAVQRFSKQHPAIDIIGYDGISDSGEEIYNFMVAEGIENVVLMGVHTNMCVLGRPFGIRQMVKLGKSVVLARDLTDAMYDPRQPPYVSHARGTELVIEHIEKYWCPTILGADLTRVIPGSDGPSQ